MDLLLCNFSTGTGVARWPDLQFPHNYRIKLRLIIYIYDLRISHHETPSLKLWSSMSTESAGVGCQGPALLTPCWGLAGSGSAPPSDQYWAVSGMGLVAWREKGAVGSHPRFPGGTGNSASGPGILISSVAWHLPSPPPSHPLFLFPSLMHPPLPHSDPFPHL